MEMSIPDTGKSRTLSASQINKAYNCQRMWAYEYIEGIKPPPNFPMKKGTFVHAVIEDFNESLEPLQGRSESELETDLKERILSVARELWEDGLIGEFEEEMKNNNEDVRKQFFNYIQSLLQRFRNIKRRTDLKDKEAWEIASPTVNELSVLVTNESGEWLFRGAVDAVYEKHPLWFDRTALVDYKTGKSPFNSDEPMSVEYSRQLDIYAWLYYQAYGVIPEVAGIHFLSEPPNSSTAFVFQEIDPGTIESIHLMIQRVREKLDGEELDEYSRNTDYQWCEFEKSDGTMIKCDHWDYCLGDEEMPEPTDNGFDGRDREPIEVVLKDPMQDDLTLSENADSQIDS
jgi:RecB family exonuclease